MRFSRFLISGALILLCTAAQAATTVENIRVWSESGKTRVVLDLSRPAAHNIFTLRGPDRLVVDLKSSRLSESLQAMPKGAGSVRSIRSAVRANGQLRVVLDLNEAVRSRSFTAGPNNKFGDRLVIDLQRSGSPHTVKTASESYQPGRDVVVAIDPGHGGHDPGAVGRGKTREKDVALQISRTLAARINSEPGMKAVLVRSGDYYVDHRRRMEIARRNKADLFISVHADAVDDRRAYGASVYALSLKGASDEAARQLAERENASVRIGDVSLEDKDEVLASVLLDLSQSAALSASLDVGSNVIGELARLGKVHRRKVQQAGFLVLKSPDMPSILVETAFISNPSEEKKLRDKRHQGRLADAILAGVRSYFYANPPPDTRIAMEMRRVPSKQVRHVIARGDTLSEIAERYNVSAAAIRAANKLSSDSIRVGQTLSIPLYAGT
ncbi:MAG: N-acetylmuramoyl-L-alanine amidase [Gammaproteobacteria bacterium]|jgi:N-acetylmuramoyl-L-alanine amidase|nr:N-acetylmuramoyl-L-alanine amidase [Gammaproteobacteria bacterium]MDH3847040.1 N-acetylmuramoyl-L-alanine amidase [Gammaproteobacteria bacterium]MDH3862783.1 N-acetylmuramoyl-L-alanine amidase [Gammaproteobacteria bacterium]MDH3905385.1 N-acetylmuramoyl-L-alanine amidase [Gammaproteobacteria bacterium]NCF58310.1 AMIN domain-containing protein [Gammaproteobacteria bacterium]